LERLGEDVVSRRDLDLGRECPVPVQPLSPEMPVEKAIQDPVIETGILFSAEMHTQL